MKFSLWKRLLPIIAVMVFSFSISLAQAQTAPEAPKAVETAPANPAQPAPPTATAAPETPPTSETAPVQPSEQPAAPAETPPAPSMEARLIGIDIVGNDKIPAAEIQAQIKLKVGDLYDATKVEADRAAIWGLGWFSHVEASTAAVEEGIRLTFTVSENAAIKSIEIEGVTVASPTKAELLALMKTKVGQVANQKYLAEDIAAIEKAYGQQGYVVAYVAGPSLSNEGALKIPIVEGKILEIKITGNKSTKSYVIQRELKSKPGTIYNIRIVQKDLERINNLGFFDNVTIHPEVGSEPGSVILVVEVVETKLTGMATIGGGWGSVGGFVATLDVSKNNWRGTGQRISFRGQIGGVKSYQAAYYHPWIAANHTSLNIAGYDSLTQREAFKSGGGGSFYYEERRTGGNITIGRPLGEYTRGSITLRRDDLAIENVQDTDVSPTDVIFEPQSVTSIKLQGMYDTRNIVANPTKGNMASLALESAGLIGGAKFSKATAVLAHYFSFGPQAKQLDIAALRKRKVVALRVMGGGTTDNPPFLEQFLVGGADTVRGYRPDRFPGKYMALVNAEFRLPFSETLQGVLFADAGDAWGGEFAQQFGDTSFKIHVGYGLGIRVQSPLGPLRLDYGIGSEGGQVHFGLSQMF